MTTCKHCDVTMRHRLRTSQPLKHILPLFRLLIEPDTEVPYVLYRRANTTAVCVFGSACKFVLNTRETKTAFQRCNLGELRIVAAQGTVSS